MFNSNHFIETSRLVKGFAKLKKPPSIRNKEKSNKLCRSIKDCLGISHCLNYLEFYNIPFTPKDLAHVAKVCFKHLPIYYFIKHLMFPPTGSQIKQNTQNAFTGTLLDRR